MTQRMGEWEDRDMIKGDAASGTIGATEVLLKQTLDLAIIALKQIAERSNGWEQHRARGALNRIADIKKS